MRNKPENYENKIEQFEEMRQLVIESQTILDWPFNWNLARLEDWKFGGNSLRVKEDPNYFSDKAFLWRNQSGKLIGYCIRESAGESVQLQLHPEYPEVLSIMLSWLDDTWSKDKQNITTFAYSSDDLRSKLLKQFGYEDQSDAGYMRKYDLSDLRDSFTLEEGFSIETLDQNKNYDSVVDAVNAAFNRPNKLNRYWLDSKQSAPSMNEEWSFSVVTENKQHVAFCFAWIDRVNKIAEIDPIGCHPDFQRRGLAKAVVLECLKRLREEGIRFAYIASGPEPNPSNRFYESLNPVETYNDRKWVKTI